MSESYAFCAIREMAKDSAFFFPCYNREYDAWCCAFGKILRKLHKSTAEYLYDRGLLEVDNLKPIFQDWFVTLLPKKYVLRIIDLYTLEGMKVIYRFAVALVDLFKTESAVFQMIATADEFWDALGKWTHDPQFNFEYLVKKAYSTLGRGFSLFKRGRVLVFPRRPIVSRIIKFEEANLIEEEYAMDKENKVLARPVGLVVSPSTDDDVYRQKEQAKPILAESIESRVQIAQWLPLSLRLTNMNLLYSTNHDGRTLERFYSNVKHAKHTILLCEVLNDNGITAGTSTVIGMFASQCWRASTRVYGDGECFLFRLQPNGQCWKWRPRVDVNDTDFAEDNHNKRYQKNNTTHSATALLEQFMVSTPSYISMGGNPDGTCGLRINEDLTKGESSPAVGFNNEQLVANTPIFEIGLVEVYGLVSPW